MIAEPLFWPPTASYYHSTTPSERHHNEIIANTSIVSDAAASQLVALIAQKYPAENVPVDCLVRRSVALIFAARGVDMLSESALSVLSEVVAARILDACTYLKEKTETGRVNGDINDLLDSLNAAGLSSSPNKLKMAISH